MLAVSVALGCATAAQAYPTPGAPMLTTGTTPNNSGMFTLGWEGADPLESIGLAYRLQHHDSSSEEWSSVASGIEALSYQFSNVPESEGTWVYRVQGYDSEQSTEFSPASEPVVVDETPPAAPSAEASRAPDYSGKGGWYKDSVTVSFIANGDPALSDGSPGSGVEPASLTAPQTFETSGSHTAGGTVADKAGNVSGAGTLTVHVDATPPTLEVSCPETALLGATAVHATVTASDDESGLASDPSGSVPIDTGHAGPATVSQTAVDNVGHETSASCTTEIEYPTPGAPAVSAGSNPSKDGLFTLGWEGADPLQQAGLSYTLQHHDASTEAWSNVATGIEALSFAFTGAGEPEGTWIYRVLGSDPGHGLTTDYSPPSEPVVVDETPPAAPSAHASRPADYSGKGGWYKDSATVSFTANGDPALSDGSPGSGVEPASLTAPQTFETSGSHTANGTVADKAGNVSGAGTLTVHVDATPPSVQIECPATAQVAQAEVTALVTASDAESGLASDPSGTVPIDTTHLGPVTVTRTAVDNVGHETSRSCTTQVIASPPEIGRCTAGPVEEVHGKLIHRGGFTKSTCTAESASHEGKYEWHSGVVRAGFTAPGFGQSAIETTAGTRLRCSSEHGSGTFTTSKTLGAVLLRFTGCEAGGRSCSTKGLAAGELQTEHLNGQVGWISASSKKVGIALNPAANNGPFMEYTCGTTPVTISGGVITALTAGKMLGTQTLKYAGKKGVQKPERFEGGARDTLSIKEGGGAAVAAVLALSTTLTFEEAIEVNPVV